MTFPHFVVACALAAFVPGFDIAAGPVVFSHKNDIPPRHQWEANGGYCGETSLISAGLYYGQYISQYDARACAIGNTPQNKGELLLGQNDRIAAARMHLRAIQWNNRTKKSTTPFLLWVKRMVLLGYPVVIGVYDNGYLLGTPQDADQQYDHIVPVARIRSRHSFENRKFFGSDRITFSDNGLFGTAHDRPYWFTFTFADFPASRKQVSGKNGPLYGLPDYGRNFGVAITGVMDADGETLPVRIATSRNDEIPVMKRKSIVRPAPMPLTLTVTVSNLTPGVAYKLYRYDRLYAVPDSRFNANAAAAAQSWDVNIPSGTSYVMTQNILSDEQVIYRAVPASAP
ncbi:MAG: hypothetical protein ACREKL_01660 [Chthoniobacterales bacterium]